ncbi:MAG: hypothetical protein R3F59_25035 [Myxococcota bacterium]
MISLLWGSFALAATPGPFAVQDGAVRRVLPREQTPVDLAPDAPAERFAGPDGPCWLVPFEHVDALPQERIRVAEVLVVCADGDRLAAVAAIALRGARTERVSVREGGGVLASGELGRAEVLADGFVADGQRWGWQGGELGPVRDVPAGLTVRAAPGGPSLVAEVLGVPAPPPQGELAVRGAAAVDLAGLVVRGHRSEATADGVRVTVPVYAPVVAAGDGPVPLAAGGGARLVADGLALTARGVEAPLSLWAGGTRLGP